MLFYIFGGIMLTTWWYASQTSVVSNLIAHFFIVIKIENNLEHRVLAAMPPFNTMYECAGVMGLRSLPATHWSTRGQGMCFKYVSET